MRRLKVRGVDPRGVRLRKIIGYWSVLECGEKGTSGEKHFLMLVLLYWNKLVCQC